MGRNICATICSGCGCRSYLCAASGPENLGVEPNIPRVGNLPVEDIYDEKCTDLSH